MNPSEKAEELISKFRQEAYRGMVFTSDFNIEREKRHDAKGAALALIAVEEIINSSPTRPKSDLWMESTGDVIDNTVEYWQSVKMELEKYLS